MIDVGVQRFLDASRHLLGRIVLGLRERGDVIAVQMIREQERLRTRLPARSPACGNCSPLATMLARTNCPASDDLFMVSVVLRRPQTAEDVLEVEGADVSPDDQQADDEAGVADAVGDERLVGRVGGAGPLVVEADQQVRADADQLPADEDLEQLSARIRLSIEKQNSDRYMKNRPKRPRRCRWPWSVWTWWSSTSGCSSSAM